jgi:histidinol-phosphatase (PHP family)
MPFDYNPEEYQKALNRLGGEQALYCSYFDQQYEMIRTLHPPVIAHFDLIRIYDDHYPDNIQQPDVRKRISRNLQLIAQLGLILDFNVAALRKGAKEPYITRPILAEAHDLNIAVVPGDDSHGIDTVGAFIPEGIKLLEQMGFDTNWRTPGPC